MTRSFGKFGNASGIRNSGTDYGRSGDGNRSAGGGKGGSGSDGWGGNGGHGSGGGGDDNRRSYGKREAPFSLRLTVEERERLVRYAGSMPLAAYIKSLLFPDDAPRYRKARRSRAADEKALAELLAILGASRISNNLNQLAKAANSGNLYFDHDTKLAIKRACDDVANMRLLLMRALGISTRNENAPPESTSQSFTRAAMPTRGLL